MNSEIPPKLERGTSDVTETSPDVLHDDTGKSPESTPKTDDVTVTPKEKTIKTGETEEKPSTEDVKSNGDTPDVTKSALPH